MDRLEEVMADLSREQLELILAFTMGAATDPGLSQEERMIASDGVGRIVAALRAREGVIHDDHR